MTTSSQYRDSPKPPVLKVTRYDLVSALMLAIVIALVVTVIWLAAVWVANRREPPPEPVPLELVELPGGTLEGALGETFRLDSPLPEIPDPSLVDTKTEETQIEETLDSVVELADQASDFAQEQFEFDVENSGNRPGSASGTGRRAFGLGSGAGGLPREQRWFVSFDDRGTLEEYARQLDYFGIELGALIAGKRLVYLSDLTEGKPQQRVSTTGKDETRLYMTWQGGKRSKADIALFEKAGFDVQNAILFQFYPAETEAMLAELERDFANRPANQIRRTYFVVRPERAGYRFQVTRQMYHR